MSSFGAHFKEKILPDILGLLTFIAMAAFMFGFASIVPYLQRLPLFRLDTSDACWFSICMAIYSPVFLFAGAIIVLVVGGFCAGVWKGSLFVYTHIILEPVRAISVIATSLFLVWVGSLGYETVLELVEFLS